MFKMFIYFLRFLRCKYLSCDMYTFGEKDAGSWPCSKSQQFDHRHISADPSSDITDDVINKKAAS